MEKNSPKDYVGEVLGKFLVVDYKPGDSVNGNPNARLRIKCVECGRETTPYASRFVQNHSEVECFCKDKGYASVVQKLKELNLNYVELIVNDGKYECFVQCPTCGEGEWFSVNTALEAKKFDFSKHVCKIRHEKVYTFTEYVADEYFKELNVKVIKNVQKDSKDLKFDYIIPFKNTDTGEISNEVVIDLKGRDVRRRDAINEAVCRELVGYETLRERLCEENNIPRLVVSNSFIKNIIRQEIFNFLNNIILHIKKNNIHKALLPYGYDFGIAEAQKAEEPKTEAQKTEQPKTGELESTKDIVNNVSVCSSCGRLKSDKCLCKYEEYGTYITYMGRKKDSYIIVGLETSNNEMVFRFKCSKCGNEILVPCKDILDKTNKYVCECSVKTMVKAAKF